MNNNEIASIIDKFTSQGNSVLFAGAGVGCRIGLPTWGEFIKHLALTCENNNEPEEAALIRKRLNDGKYLEAATIFKTCTSIPVTLRYKALTELFKKDSSEINKLQALSLLPFSGIVTTNYDRSLLNSHAIEHQKAPLTIELDDPTLRNAELLNEFFIARIHGRIEAPQNMVVDVNDYDKLKKNDAYNDFLTSLFRTRPIMFIGFSFIDPAINIILDVLKEAFYPNFPELHTALIPTGDTTGLKARLTDINIQVIEYEADPEHKNLWRSIRIACDSPIKSQKETPPEESTPDSSFDKNIHKALSFTYACSQTIRQKKRPAMQLAHDGLVISLFCDTKGTATKDQIVNEIRNALKISIDDSADIFESTAERLMRNEILHTTGDGIWKLLKDFDNPLLDRLIELSDATKSRAYVLDSKNAGDIKKYDLTALWEKIFLERTWQIAPQYAGSITSKTVDLDDFINKLVIGNKNLAAKVKPSITLAILSILRNPEPSEVSCLSEISRAALTVQMAFSSPRASIRPEQTLPNIIYFDSSFLLPAIVKGHPLHKGYIDALRRLLKATIVVGGNCSLRFCSVFIEEILIHKKNSKSLVSELGLENSKKLKEHILMYGAENTNVFIAAYASKLRSNDKPIKFAEFVNTVAPYNNEQELSDYLKKDYLIQTDNTSFETKNNTAYNHVYTHLVDGYSNDTTRLASSKKHILIEHEAVQLTKLFVDLKAKKRAIFITADRKLTSAIRSSTYIENLFGHIVSPLGFIGLIDVLIGLEPNSEMITRLIWGSNYSSTDKQIRDYLVSITIDKYDGAMLRAMPEVLDDLIRDEQKEINNMSQFASSGRHLSSALELEKHMDRLEEKYFQNMQEWMEKHPTE
ncbi:SIR2 family protein [Coraliomargarita sp. SDUM461003]|uniref:SIR2 family protein n=1 Tax=Thalassobacterium maritimum TaxID=3041265 RepID=A0ABU1AZR1_9BACT|nr:SIR2 family protein [Coraliomargarita sp. SDUM461003]MDQ8209147.1 SIR2 family protein [Coraliomargarita sp. SDUM461003]